MEVASGVLRRAAIGRGFGFRPEDVGADRNPSPSSFAIGGLWKKNGRKESGRLSVGGGYADEGHLRYYASSSTRCGGWGKKQEEREKERKEKRRARLVKELSMDLSALCAMGFGVEDDEAIAGEGRRKMNSEVAELLLAELNQLRAQEETKKDKKNKKKEEKSKMKAAKMKGFVKDDESSSSSESSSESSDSECEVVDMSSLKADIPILEVRSKNLALPTFSLPTCNPCSQAAGEQPADQQINLKLGQECPSAFGTSSSSIGVNVFNGKSAPATNMPMDNKIEVCLGGKCKKSGALNLMAEFEKEIGMEGAVVGCKCMGKCKQGPNVRVMVVAQGEGEIQGLKNPVCTGVGLKDVSTIVANFFQEKKLVSV